MEALQNILIQLNPADHQRMVSYTLFLVNGPVPFTARDLQSLWDEWRTTPDATAIQFHRYDEVPSSGTRYGVQWSGEREKFFNLFKQFALLEKEGKSGTMCLIYPDGKEVFWTPASNTNAVSHRGPQLVQALRVLNPTSQLGVAVTVQFNYNDDPALYQVPATRTAIPGLIESVGRTRLDKGYTPSPTLTSEPLPVAVLRDFWLHFRNHSSRLTSKYGVGTEQPSPLFQQYRGLYEKGGFQPFFQRFAELDSTVSPSKLIMASFIHDGGFQYVIYRLAGKGLRGTREMFALDKLPATPGTKLIGSKAPKDVRMIVKAIYVEK
jgi:hypothetical protein